MGTKKVRSLSDIKPIKAYLDRIGAEPRSLKTAVIKEMHGKYWRDVTQVFFTKEGDVKAEEGYEPTEAEAEAIKVACLSANWPELKKLKRLTTMPKQANKTDPRDIFEFRDINGDFIMLQIRMVDSKGERHYIPYTYWDDNEWRSMEPDGLLPLWGLDQLKDHSVVFIHEGAKGARFVREMVEGKSYEAREALKAHPWGDELNHAAHIGWIGGAINPHRTDWTMIKKLGIRRAYIVSDNDTPGLQAVPRIAQELTIPTFHVQFTNEWPTSFDLADPFPDSMFQKLKDKRYYIGPSFRECLHPATWATDQFKPKEGKGRPSNRLRAEFKKMWAYVEKADLFVCTEMPEIVRTEQVLNKMLSAFSHTANTAALIVKNYRGRQTSFCYRPDVKGRIVTDRGTASVNLHMPANIKAQAGDTTPFIEFMTYLFPNEKERHEVMRWCATLIAYPETRMEYGLLLVSERQGVGKTTLGSRILQPLVGEHNTGHPSEGDIVNSEFNGWLANKRLVLIQEIYSGHSWKAYNKLKSLITDPDVTVNEKFQRPYVIENWSHMFACSNSLRALKMEEDDRRWYYPEVTETPWPREKFIEFYQWLQSGGLSIIAHWAHMFNDYVYPSQRAPMTDRKRDLIDDSRSEAQQEVADLAHAILSAPEPVAIGMKAITAWCRSSVHGQVFDSDYELRKAMKDAGVLMGRTRVRIEGRMQYVVMNQMMATALSEKANIDRQADILREGLRQPQDLLGNQM